MNFNLVFQPLYILFLAGTNYCIQFRDFKNRSKLIQLNRSQSKNSSFQQDGFYFVY